MVARSSVSTDHLSAAVESPGIDPRVQLTLANVTDVRYDAAEGVFVDIQYQPGGEIETALLGAPYAGNGFGAYFPVNINDTVLVAVPLGDPGYGPMIIARQWNGGDPPPGDITTGGDEVTGDIVIRVEPKKKIRIVTSDVDGDVSIQVEGNGKVQIQCQGTGNVSITTATGNVWLGDENLTALLDGVVTARAIDPFTGQTQGFLGNESLKVMASKGGL